MDTTWTMRNTHLVPSPGAARIRLADILNVAFARGLLSDQTLSHRLGVVFGQRLIDPSGVVGDLQPRNQRPRWRWPSPAATVIARRRAIAAQVRPESAPFLLALDWITGDRDLVIGRGPRCDIALVNDSVSRQHAKLTFRDGTWIIQDLASTNGTIVNGKDIGRSQLHPGDSVRLGDQLLVID
jgi:hypothetical protein